jgi:hypothetical protein
MIKRILILFLAGIMLQSCKKAEKDLSPKCDDPKVIELVLNTFEKNIDRLKPNERTIQGIFTTNSNKELKTCECEGTVPTTILRYVKSGYAGRRPISKRNPTIKYKVQKNENGEISVRMQSEMPQR